jgi:glycosyltransferase involved in cell wall biosynthesis
MKILIASGHRYPARDGGTASDRIADCLAKGLAELGHRVVYKLEGGAASPLPEGVELVRKRRYDVDAMVLQDYSPWDSPETRGIPWVRPYHSPCKPRDGIWRHIRRNWIFVSKAHASSFYRRRYVTNGIDPRELIYSETKGDYFLFVVANLATLQLKGFEVARALVRACGLKLVVAGGFADRKPARELLEMFAREGIAYAGHVSGERKAELFAGARALLFPTQANETFGLVVAEALMSGTPVICSDRGACPELVPPEAGYVCSNFPDYVQAVENVGRISPLACRVLALERYHYLRMARDYVSELEKEIALWSSLQKLNARNWVKLELGQTQFAVGIS